MGGCAGRGCVPGWLFVHGAGLVSRLELPVIVLGPRSTGEGLEQERRRVAHFYIYQLC